MNASQYNLGVKPWPHCPSCAGSFDAATDPAKPLAFQHCGACGFTRYVNPVPVVAGLVETPEGVILVHNKTWQEGMLGLVTGFIESGEGPEAAIVREVHEELGLDASVDHLIGHYPVSSLGQLVICYALNAHGTPRLGNELDDLRIIPRDRLRSWEFGTGLAVRDWLALRKNGNHRRPVMNLLEILGRRWVLRILWELSECGPLGFRDLRAACDDLSPDTLSSRLKDLNAALLVKNDGAGGPWSLTDHAVQLRPHLLGLAKSAARNCTD